MWQCYIQTFTSTKYSLGSPQSPWPSSWDRSLGSPWDTFGRLYHQKMGIQSRRASCRTAGCTACPAFPTPRTLSCSPRTPHWLVAIREKGFKERRFTFSAVSGTLQVGRLWPKDIKGTEQLNTCKHLHSRISCRLKINEASNLIIITSIIRSTKAFSAQSS